IFFLLLFDLSCQILYDYIINHCSFSLIMWLLRMVPFFYVGTQIHKNFAALLEEHDVFVPEDDDDWGVCRRPGYLRYHWLGLGVSL
uniref:Essential MCU regulator, mitochondrial n=1 Tax=Scophthalmus maximus TaxID=52904 RepID=A0A8D3CDH8_SCOMX